MSELEAEWGGGWHKPRLQVQAKLVDSEGKEILCACGKPSAIFIAGKEAFVAYCFECSPMYKEQQESNFVYRPPNYAGPMALNKGHPMEKLMDAYTIKESDFLTNLEDKDE